MPKEAKTKLSLSPEYDTIMETVEKTISETIAALSLPKGVEITQQDFQLHRNVDKTDHDQLVEDYLNFLSDILHNPSMRNVDIVARYQETDTEIEVDRFTKWDDHPNADGTIDTHISIQTTTLTGDEAAIVTTANSLNDRMNQIMDYTLRTL